MDRLMQQIKMIVFPEHLPKVNLDHDEFFCRPESSGCQAADSDAADP